MPATKKTSGSKTAKAGQKAKSSKKIGNYGPSYVALRTVLDALELAAIRYYLDGKTATERNARQEKMRTMIVPVVQEIYSLTDPNEGQIARCPPGYYNCSGCCLPYPCPQ